MTTKTGNKHYGLSVYQIGRHEYAVGDDTDKSKDAKGRTRVDRAARRAVIAQLNSVDPAFTARFLVAEVPAFAKEKVDDVTSSLVLIRECSSATAFLRAALGRKFQAFVDAVIDNSGRAEWLADHDGREVTSDSVEGLPRGKVAFRIF